MSKKEKALARFKSRPRDFSWAELQTLMGIFGFTELSGDGSRRKFFNRATGRVVILHKRHPDDTLLPYQMKAVREFLEQEGVI